MADGQIRGEVLLAGGALHLPAGQVFEVLLHEAALLAIRAMAPYGLAGTSLTALSRERYGVPGTSGSHPPVGQERRQR